MEGRVEVCMNENWKALCFSESWDDNAASVICRQLGVSSRGIYCIYLRERERGG
jgi:hypothetical protein